MSRLRIVLSALTGVVIFAAGSSILQADDWPQWGRRSDRNMVSDENNLPDTFAPGGTKKDDSGEYKADIASARNVKWAVKLGSQTYGNPTVAGGKVFIGTNDNSLQDQRLEKTNGGIVMCLDEATGNLLWQLIIPRFRTNKKQFNFDDLNIGVCSSPTVQDNRVYLVTNRGEVLCLDVNGQANGNDGPYQDEGRYIAGPNRPPVPLRSEDGDIIWCYDMISEVPSWPQDASNCSVLLYGDLVYVCTSNGVDRSHDNVPYPESPSLIALDKNTGCLAAKDGENIGKRLFHGQWSSPAMGIVNGKPQVFYGGGDGVCYAFEPPRVWSAQGEVVLLRKIWSCDCNPPDYKFRNGKPIPYQKKHNSFNNDTKGEGPSEIISTPVFYNNRVYVAVGQDPQHGRGKGALTCIDATRQGDITETGKLWTCKLVDRSLSTVSIADGLVYIADYSGNLHCLDADTGERYWVHETNSPVWSSTLVADGKIYLGTENRDLWVLKTGKEKKILAQIRLREKMYNTPVVANGILYVATQQYLYAIQSPH